ncbi:MAG: YjbE family putative metal transport protein [Proteobacteria bacterium]|nr:YjbE family putative metal transport protein [Pseudomonadota bacterium]
MCQVIFIDLVLAGDNAIVVGMVAAGVAPEQRRRVIIGGIATAVVLRIMFAAVTMQLLGIIGLTLAGGLLLLWVCWKLYRELREQAAEASGVQALDNGNGESGMPRKTIRQAIVQVAVADFSMSLDNVLAVAGAASDHPRAMVFGLILSVVLMGVGATFIAHLLQRHQWIAYLGLAVIGYVAVSMTWRGGFELASVAGL